MKNKNILIIDDNPFDVNLLSTVLTRKLGCQIVTSHNGQQALSLLDKQRFDLILLDVEMPDMSGDEVVVEVRKNRTFAELPIIMVSGKSDDEIVIKCLNVGANDYILKPIKLRVALMRIENQLRLSEAIQDRMSLQEIKAISALIVTYNHEINNPLAIALGTVGLLKKNAPHQDALEKIETSLWRIANIVKKIQALKDKSEFSYEEYSPTSKTIKID